MNVLVLAPHTDDGELGCGGTIAKHVEDGDAVYYVAFTALDSDQLRAEARQATRLLGLPASNLILFDYKVREFASQRQSILDSILSVREAVSPQIVYCPCLNDIHQDHRVVAMEAVRGLRNTTILGYEFPRNNLTFSAQAFTVLSEAHLTKKIESVWCYDSQKSRTYTTDEFIRAHAHLRGVQIDRQYAEAFEVIRWIK